MEIKLRIVMLSLGLLILFGVAIDVFRRRGSGQKINSYSAGRVNNNDLSNVSSAELRPEDYIVDPVFAADDISDELHVGQPDYDLPDLDPDCSSTAIAEHDYQPTQDFTVTAESPSNQVSIQDLIAVFIMSRSPFGFNGDELYNAITNAHFHLGKNNLFYRYARDDGQGDALFSLVKAVEPGYFNIDILRQEHVPGITLLMLPSKCSDPALALDKLIRAAKQMAYALNAELLDHAKKPLTLDMIEQYKQQIQIIHA